MKKLILIFFVALLLAACAHGKTAQFPTAAKASEAAEVVIIRNNNLFGWGFTVKVLCDDIVIAHLRTGEHVTLLVAPGFHTIGIPESTMTVPCSSGQTYYFLISADYTQFGFEIERISSAKGENWLAKTKAVE